MLGDIIHCLYRNETSKSEYRPCRYMVLEVLSLFSGFILVPAFFPRLIAFGLSGLESAV